MVLVVGKRPRRRGGGEGGSDQPWEVPPASGPLEALVRAFESLPGVGRKTAERLAYHVLRSPREEAMRLCDAIRDVKENLRHCSVCFNVASGERCSVCEDPSRDAGTVCVVERPTDVQAIEATGSYRGRYHVLLGALAPLEGVGDADLTVDALVARVREGGIREVILATNPNFEGDGTALYVRDRLKAFPGVRVTRIARGVPSGSHLERMGKTIVSDALEGRREMPD